MDVRRRARQRSIETVQHRSRDRVVGDPQGDRAAIDRSRRPIRPLVHDQCHRARPGRLRQRHHPILQGLRHLGKMLTPARRRQEHRQVFAAGALLESEDRRNRLVVRRHRAERILRVGRESDDTAASQMINGLIKLIE